MSLGASKLVTKGNEAMGITTFMRPISMNGDIYCAIFIAKTGAPMSLLDDDSFDDYLDYHKAQGLRIKRHRLCNISIPLCEKLLREFIIQRLYKKSVCIVVDEMTKYGTSFTNFLLCCPLTKEGEIIPGLFFWDSRVLDNGKAESIGEALADIADELLNNGIEVNSYVSDNCNTMKKSEDYAVTKNGRKLQRKSCCSHVPNNIFKEFLAIEPIKSIWGNVYLLFNVLFIAVHC